MYINYKGPSSIVGPKEHILVIYVVNLHQIIEIHSQQPLSVSVLLSA